MGDALRLEALLRSIEHPQPVASATNEGPSAVAAAMKAVVGHWPTIALTSAAAVTLAVVYLAMATAQFTASGLILIDLKNGASLRSNAPTVSDANVDSANIESQVELLKSDRILRRVVAAEHLEDDPALQPGPVARAVTAVTGAVMFWKQPAMAPEGADPKVTAAARALQKLTTAKRLGTTYVVEVSATMPSPTQAAAVANAYADAFIQDQAAMREELSRRMSNLLKARTDELQSETRKAENAVEQFKFSGSLGGESSAQARVTLKNLESKAQTYRVLHDKFLERYAETWQQQFMTLPDAQVASFAYPPSSKSAPKSTIILAASLFVGVALGLLIVLMRDRRVVGLGT